MTHPYSTDERDSTPAQRIQDTVFNDGLLDGFAGVYNPPAGRRSRDTYIDGYNEGQAQLQILDHKNIYE